MPQLTARESGALEREYVAHRSVVLAMLRSEFGGVPDHEELYQDAWTEALEIQARGGEIVNLGGLLRTIAWRRARDRLRKQRPAALDPASALFGAQADPAAPLDEQAVTRFDAAVIRQVVDSLEPRQAAAIKLRFDCHLDAREIGSQLGVTPKRLEKIVTEAYARVEQCLSEGVGGSSEWRRRQRSILLACETGLASSRQRRQARRMVAEDPVCRAMLREIRSRLEEVAAVLPLPVLFAAHGRVARWRFDALERFGDARDLVASWAARVSGRTTGLEEAGAGGGATLGAGAAVKAALMCAAVAGGTACLVPGGTAPPRRPPAPVAREAVVSRPSAVRLRPIVLPRPVASPVRARHPARHRPAATSASAPAAPSPAPSGSTEFGPGAVGSSSAPSTPSAAPASSGSGGEFLP